MANVVKSRVNRYRSGTGICRVVSDRIVNWSPLRIDGLVCYRNESSAALESQSCRHGNIRVPTSKGISGSSWGWQRNTGSNNVRCVGLISDGVAGSCTVVLVNHRVVSGFPDRVQRKVTGSSVKVREAQGRTVFGCRPTHELKAWISWVD